MTVKKDPTDSDFFYSILRIRAIEERIASLYSEQLMRCPVHLSIGQEAVAVGVCAAIRNTDYAMSGHRSHAHYLAKGGSLKAMMAELYGKSDGCTGGMGGSMHLVDLNAGFIGAVPIVGSTIPIAVGTALSSQMEGSDRVTIAFFGEGATEEGVFHESINFASLKKLPVIFVCENNLFSVYSPMSVRQPSHREVFEQAKGHGVESYQVDGNNVADVYELTKKAVAKARAGDGPTFLEFKTYRWREHCGPNYDNDIGYRAVEEFESWRALDPLEALGNKLLIDSKVTPEQRTKAEQQIAAEIDEAVAFARASTYPKSSTIFEHLFA